MKLLRLTSIVVAFLACAAARAELRFEKIVLCDQFFSEGANAGDFNGDGKPDIVAGPFWYEGPDFRKRHRYCPEPVEALDPHGYSKHFFSFIDDVNHDGRIDIIVVGFPGEAGFWYENPGPNSDQPWRQHLILDHVDDESPGYEDLTGDGVRELVCIHAGQFGYAARDPKAPDKPWLFHPISPKNNGYQKFTHGLGVGDVNGDGRADLIDKDGWWEHPADLAGDPMWQRHEFKFADAGAQMYALDLNGDQKPDVITSLNAHGYGLAWYSQTADGSFEKHLILGDKPADNPQGICFTQLHSVAIADMNGDGIPDIVTGKRHWAHGPEHDPEPNNPAVLYWFEGKRNPDVPGGIEFIPHQIDDDSGVGTQVVVTDLNGDGKPDIVVGNKNGAFAFIQQTGGLSSATTQPTTQATAQANGQGSKLSDPFAQNIRTTEPLSPEQERLALHVPDGFEVQLVASEPEIAKPLNMAFDGAGRLWVSTTVEYPFPAVDRKGRDQIRILDIGPDGHAANISTFAQDLNIPIGIYPYRDGCIGFNIPEIRRYYDDNGDGKADRIEKLYGTFGDHDTHGMTNAFRRGFDGWLYACHGFNNTSTITGSDGASITLNSGNTYRMRVDGSHVEQFTWGQTNPYGLCFDPLGNIYSSDSHSKPIYQLTRGGYYEGINKVDDGLGFAPPMMHHNHGSTAIAGVLDYQADQFPAEWRGHMFVGNVVTSRINHDTITYSGASPTAHEEKDFLYSDDPWFRPVDIQLGPDGAIYVADFYNRIIGHYEVPLDNPQRDHERGRIWRIVYRGGAGSPSMPNLRKADVSALIAALGDSNLTVRRLAMDELSDRIGGDCVEPIRKVLADGKASPLQTIHAMWVLYRLRALDAQQIVSAAHADDAMIRVHAMRMLAETAGWTPEESAVALAGLHDGDAFVRRCSADALATHPAADHIPPLLELLATTPADDFQLRYQVRVALRDQLRDSGAFARLDSLKLTDDQLRVLLDITPAVASNDAAAFEMAHLDLIANDHDAVVKVVQHAIKNSSGDASINAAVAEVRKLLVDDLDLQLSLFAVVEQSIQQRGGAITQGPVREWSVDLATRAIRDAGKTWGDWHPSPLPGSRQPSTNPWRLQHRSSADRVADALFWSSLPGGESLTGVLRSGSFTIPPSLSFYLAGHNGPPQKKSLQKNFLRLRSAADDRILREAAPPRKDIAQKVTWDLSEFAGQTGYLEAVDGATGLGYAWLAFGRLEPEVVAIPRSGVSDTSLAEAFEIAQSNQLTDLADPIRQLIQQTALDPSSRASAMLALVACGDEAAAHSLGGMIANPDVAAALREKIARDLGKIDSTIARQALLDAMRTASGKLQLTIAQSLCGSGAGGEALLSAIAAGHASAKLLQEQTLVDALNAANVQDASSRIATLTKGLPSPRAELQQLLDQRRVAFTQAHANQTTSVDRGKKVFTATCIACHQLDGQGRQIGPQLDGIGARGVDRVIEDVLDPSRNVDPAFRYSTLMLTDGDVITGLYHREEPGDVLVFVDATGKEIPIPKSKIKRRIDSVNSLMPDNFSSAIPESDFYDLIEYLLAHRAKPSK